MMTKQELKMFQTMYQKSQRKGGNEYWYPSQENSLIRFLPLLNNNSNFVMESGGHKVGDQYFFCLRLNGNKRCPLCVKSWELYSTKDPDDRELAKSIKPKEKFFYQIIDRNGNDPTKVEIYSTGPRVKEKLLSYYIDPDYGKLHDIQDGYDFRLIRKVVDSYANYNDSRPVKNPSPLASTQTEIDEILAKRIDLSTLINLKNYDELKTALDEFLGVSVEEKIVIKQTQPKLDEKKEAVANKDIDKFERNLIRELGDD